MVWLRFDISLYLSHLNYVVMHISFRVCAPVCEMRVWSLFPSYSLKFSPKWTNTRHIHFTPSLALVNGKKTKWGYTSLGSVTIMLMYKSAALCGRQATCRYNEKWLFKKWVKPQMCPHVVSIVSPTHSHRTGVRMSYLSSCSCWAVKLI